jgi:hypothetical protein
VWRLLEERESLWNVVIRAKYGEEGGRVRFREGVGSVWWRNINQIRMGAGLIDSRWLVDNIIRRVGDGRDTLFWVDPWLDECPLIRSFGRLYDLAENKLATVSEMFELGWGVGGEAWKWRRRLFAWEEGLVLECVERVSSCILQVGMVDRWVWKLHTSQCYTVKSAYSFLTASDTNLNEGFDSFLWLKAVPLKVNLFVWRLFLNRLPTKDNLFRRGAIDAAQLSCAALCGDLEDRDHLFFRCGVYGRIWLLISKWLGFESAFNATPSTHAYQFCGLGDFSKNSRTVFAILWISVLFVVWKDRNNRIFQNRSDQIETLAEKVKLQTFWWLKSHYTLFDFDYSFWRLNPLCCMQALL